jgi:hypothetical protein
MAKVAVSVIFKTSLEFIGFLTDAVDDFLPNVRARNEVNDDMKGKTGMKIKRIDTALINPSFITSLLTTSQAKF